MRNLALSSFVLLLACSCSLSHQAIQQQDIGSPDVKPVFWFTCDTCHYLFNTKINLLDDRYSGILVIKCLPGNAHRVVFFTAIGLKIFDIEHTTEDKFVIHYLLDALNRNGLVKTFKNDVNLLLMNGMKGVSPEILQKKSTGEVVFKYVNNGRKFYLTLSEEACLKQQVIQKTGLSKKVRADYYGNERTGIDSVKIVHYHFGLSIAMNRIIEDHVAE